MTDASHIAALLSAVANRTDPGVVSEADLAMLQQRGLLQLVSPDQQASLQQSVQQLQAAQAAIAEVEQREQSAASAVAADTRRTHSILFHLQGVDREEATVDRLHEEQEALQALEADLAKRQADFQQLLVQRSTLEGLMPFQGKFIGLTTAGRVALRDLNVALYRVGGQDFSAYWTQAQAVDAQLNAIASQAATLHHVLESELANVDPSYLWAVAIGMAKQPGTPDAQVPAFLEAYRAVAGRSPNVENALLAAEVLSGAGRPMAAVLPELDDLKDQVELMGVPSDASLGVAAILVGGVRADGTYATEPLARFLGVTPSYEAATLLAIVNKPAEDLARTFGQIKGLFASWNYSVSEDTELSSAYLTLSDLPMETVGTKMAILARGVGAYLQYPLVAAAVLASIPVLEANETLNLLEKAYELLGRQTGPMPQPELITLAVRLVHGVDVRSVNELDPTQAAAPAYPSFQYAAGMPRVWIPVFVVHAHYFSTYGAIGGAHPGHIHAVGGGGWFGGFGG